jgi:DNA-binding YbaB/EbfC family protein
MQFRGGMSELMRQASRLQRKIETRKQELANETVQASAGGEQVTVTVNGAGSVTRVSIAKDLLGAGDVSMLEDLIAAATNAAMEKQKAFVDAELEKVTGGVKIPGMV